NQTVSTYDRSEQSSSTSSAAEVGNNISHGYTLSQHGTSASASAGTDRNQTQTATVQASSTSDSRWVQLGNHLSGSYTQAANNSDSYSSKNSLTVNQQAAAG